MLSWLIQLTPLLESFELMGHSQEFWGLWWICSLITFGSKTSSESQGLQDFLRWFFLLSRVPGKQPEEYFSYLSSTYPFIYQDLWWEIGLCDWGWDGGGGKCGICIVGCKEGKAGDLGRSQHCSPQMEFLPQGSLQPFSGLDQVHPYYPRKSPLHKVNWL